MHQWRNGYAIIKPTSSAVIVRNSPGIDLSPYCFDDFLDASRNATALSKPIANFVWNNLYHDYTRIILVASVRIVQVTKICRDAKTCHDGQH